jgi:ferredoxin
MIGQVLFLLLLSVTGYLAWKGYARILRNVRLGQDFQVTGNTQERWRRVLLIAFGQKKMFSNMLPAVLHLFIYVAFLFTQIELIEILADGLSGRHRMFAGVLGPVYTVLISFIEILSLLALVATVVFLARRNLIHVPRFRKPEMKGWPSTDANLILVGEILLIAGIFSMNGADTVLQSRLPAQYPGTGALAISSWLGPILFQGWETPGLILMERAGWWLHIMVVFGFLAYLPHSKHLHILLAFPNTWYASLKPRGQMENMPAIMNEVRSMMGLPGAESGPVGDELPEFGAHDVTGLSWKNILDAYTCTECGRCTAQCPANTTGKKLSPRKIMMDIRDRADEVGARLASGDPQWIREDQRGEGAVLSKDNYHDGKSLFDYISPEEIHACTTCQACVEACPVLINPLEPILQMRRYEILTLSSGPSDWLPMFNSLENSQSAWQIPQDRDQWAREASES